MCRCFTLWVFQDQAIYGCITIVLLTGIVIVGLEWEAKAQIVLLIILLAAIADFCIGSILGPKSDLEVAQGFVGYNSEYEEIIYSIRFFLAS